MSQLPGNPRPQVKYSVGSNIFTLLMAISVLALLTAVIVVGYYNVKLTGQSNPFAVVPKAVKS